MLVRCFKYCFDGSKIPIVLVWTGKSLTVFHLEDNACLYTRLLSKTLRAAKFYLTKNSCVKASRNFTLHLIKVGKLRRFKKVSSDLKTILKTDLADLRLLAVS